MKPILEQLYPGVVDEYKFHPKRRWKFDFAWPDKMIALEIEGGAWTQGRHTRGKGFRNDCIKYNQAVILGWKLIRVTTDMVNDGSIYEALDEIFKQDTKEMLKMP